MWIISLTPTNGVGQWDWRTLWMHSAACDRCNIAMCSILSDSIPQVRNEGSVCQRKRVPSLSGGHRSCYMISDILLHTGYRLQMHIHSILSRWHRNCICFPPNNQIQRATLGQTEDDCALQAFPAGWLEAELLYLGISDAIHAVYSRNDLEELIDITRGFWCSKDACLNVIAIIAMKCEGPTQHKYPCYTDLAQRQGTSGSIVRER